MRAFSEKVPQCFVVFLLAAGTFFFTLQNARAQEVGDSGCVAYCNTPSSTSSPSSSTPSGGSGGPGGIESIIGSFEKFFQGLKERKRKKRYGRMIEENDKCLAFGNNYKWIEAEAACQKALDYCDNPEHCAIIHQTLTYIGTNANKARAKEQTYQQAKRKGEALNEEFGRLIDSLNIVQTLRYSDPNVVDLTFLDPTKPIILAPSKVKAGMDPLPTSRKAEMLLTALDEGRGNWQKSIKFLEDYLFQSPWDAEARDAYTYLLGMYKGYLAHAEWANLYYRRGVWDWMLGDYAMAAASLAQAVVSNPDDLGAKQLYAYVLGERDGSGYCEKEICVHNDIETDPDLVDYKIPPKLDYLDDPRMDALRKRVETNPEDLKARNLLHYIEGLAVYAQYEQPKPDPFSPEAAAHVSNGLRLMVLNDFKGAAAAFTEAHHFAGNNHNVTFARYYSLGVESGRQAGLGANAKLPWDKRLLDVMFEVLPDITGAQFLAKITGEDPDIILQGIGAEKFGQEELAYIKEFMTKPVITVSADDLE